MMLDYIIINDGLNTGRKGMKMRNKLKIVFLLFIITVIPLGCIESQKPSDSNETRIDTPEPTPEQKLPAYNETKPLKISDTFVTWSRGYISDASYEHSFFRIIKNYSEWTIFLDNNRLEGTLFPGIGTGVKPMIIGPADFNEHFIIAAMMGRKGKYGPEIEIVNINIIKNTVNVTVRLYEPTAGGAAISSPYHIVIAKRELLPAGNSTFVFIDTEGKLLEKVEVSG